MDTARLRGRFTTNKNKSWHDNLSKSCSNRFSENSAPPQCESTFSVEGRRVVEISTLADQLWCPVCKVYLGLKNIVSETSAGLASIFKVKCIKCLSFYSVKTCKSSCSKNAQHPLYDVNFKLAMGLLDGGFGVSQLNTVLSCLNVPAVSPSLVKRYERVVGPAIEKLALEGCQANIEEERRLTLAAAIELNFQGSYSSPDMATPAASTPSHEIVNLEDKTLVDEPVEFTATQDLQSPTNESEDLIPQSHQEPSPVISESSSVTESSLTNEGESVGLSGSIDAAWQTRGSGHAYDSLTGHSSLIGRFSKIMSYATRQKRCARCQKGHEPSDHDCRLNFTGNAKAIEADLAKEMVAHNHLLKKKNCHIAVLIADDDSSTAAAVRREATHPVEKWSDFNHAAKAFGRHLRFLKLSQPAVDYLAYLFSIAVSANKGDVKGVQEALLSVVPHAFDDHWKCDDRWCGWWRDPENYKHKFLPGGDGLNAPNRKGVEDLFATYAKEEYAKKLAPIGSTQVNESFNHILSTKLPNDHSYGRSESSSFRVAASVCHSISGVEYVSEVFEKMELSPGGHTRKFRAAKKLVRKYKSAKAKTILFKNGRIRGKRARQMKRISAENKEGTTYKTGMGFEAEFDELGCAPLPDNSDVPIVRGVPSLDPGSLKTVVFDLETTGFGKPGKVEIVQLAASFGDQNFSVYILPTKSIHSKASEVTNLTVENGELCYHGNPVSTLPARIAMHEFLQFLRQIGKNIVLIAHNCFTFDASVLTAEMKKLQMWTLFVEVVAGFADSLPLFKAHLKDRVKEKKSFKLTELANDYLPPSPSVGEAHNAIAHVKMLQDLLRHFNCNDVSASMKSVDFVQCRAVEKAKLNALIFNLASALKDSKGMITKIATAGISVEMLLQAHNSNKDSGRQDLLSELVAGKPRVTKTKSSRKFLKL